MLRSASILCIALFFSLLPIAAQTRANCGPWVTAAGNDCFTVCWITSQVSAGAVRLDSGITFYENGHAGKLSGRLHNVKVTGLKPGSSYSYSIPAFRPGTFTTTTLDPGKKNCRFVMFNDVHEADELMKDEIDADSITSDNCDFVLFNGDMASSMDSIGDIVNYMLPICQTFAGSVPIFTARGNHECRGIFAGEYLDFFPTSNGRCFYTFREGPVFFIVLDGGDNVKDKDLKKSHDSRTYNDFRRAEADWLKKVVASEVYINAPHRIVVLHIPPETKRQWEGREMVKDFASILNGTHVDLMVCGHEHEHLYYPAGSDESGCDFPVFINDLHARADIKVTPKKIEISAHKNNHKIKFEGFSDDGGDDN